MRVDKYIWAIRIFKTRSIASKACNDGKVLLNNEITKCSKNVKIDDTISIKEIPIWRKFLVLEIPKSRIGPKLVKKVVKEITSEDDLELLNQHKLINQQNRNLGFKGRPTKKERRNLDNLSF